VLLCSGSALWLAACSDEVRREPVDAGLAAPQDAGRDPAAVPDAAPPPEPPPARICSGDGWCWNGPGLQNAALYAIAANGPSDLWAVGELGLTLHFDGQRWDARWAPERHTLRALSAAGTEVWAAGDEGTLLHLVNQSWRAEPLPELPDGAQLRGVWAEADGRVWVVGDGGLLRERSGGAWSSVEVAGGAALNAVWSDGTDVWAVGAAGTVLRKGADGWARVDAGTARDLTSVAGRGGEVWVAGVDGEIRRYDSAEDVWARPDGEGPAPSGQLRALQVGAARVFVADERGHLFVWDTTTTCPVPGDAGAPEQPCPRWLDVCSTPDEFPIASAWASGSSLMAVGASGSITRWEGDVRTALSAGSRDNYLDVSGSTDDDVWIAGDRLLHRRAGGEWQALEMSSPRAIYAVQSLAERTLIAGTGGLARGYANDAWLDMDVRPDAWLRGLWGDASSAWLVGARGSSFGLLNGRLWTPLATPTTRDLLAVYGVPGGSVWAVGAGGVVLRHDGTLWAAIPSGPDGGVSADLRAVWGSADHDVWAAGTGGTLLHWDGRVWTRASEEAAFSLNAVWGRAADDVWAAGTGGTLLHYDGSAWRAEFSGTSQALNALWGSSRQLWAVGEHGTLLVKELD
jgi:hypothetical protein